MAHFKKNAAMVVRVHRGEEVKRVRAWEPVCLVQTTPHPLLEAVTLLVLNFLSCKVGMVLGLPHWAPVKMQ